MFQIITGSRFGSSKNDLRCPCYLNFKLLFFQILLTSQMRWFWSANFGLKRNDFFLVFLFSFWGSCSRSMHFLCHPAHKRCSFLTSDQNEVACDPPKHTSSKKKTKENEVFTDMWRKKLNSQRQKILLILMFFVDRLLTFRCIFGHFEPTTAIYLGFFL